MREIRFRGRDKKTGKWVYGDLTHSKGINADGEQLTYDRVMVGGYEVDEDTVGQNIFLFDKKGYEIYEGDIILTAFKDGSKCYALIGWNNDSLMFGFMDEYAYRSLKQGYTFPCFDNEFLLNCHREAIVFEIKGNLWDNPELLEGGEQ